LDGDGNGNGSFGDRGKRLSVRRVFTWSVLNAVFVVELAGHLPIFVMLLEAFQISGLEAV
jgi:hypothetical protein